MKFLERYGKYFLNENYEIAERNWVERGGVPKEEFTKYTDKFKQHIKKKNVSGREADIAGWMKKPFDEFKSFVKELDKKSEEKQKEKTKKKEAREFKLVFENDNAKVIIPKTEEASCWFGQNTKWCTTGKQENHFHEYYDKEGHTLYYILLKGPMDTSLMNKAKSVYRWNDRIDGGLKIMKKMFEDIDPKNYNKVCVVAHQNSEELKELGKKHTYIYDALDNTMTNAWFRTFLSKYNIPDNIFTKRMVKTKEGSYTLDDKL